MAVFEPLASGVDTVTGTVTFTGCEAFVEAVAGAYPVDSNYLQ